MRRVFIIGTTHLFQFGPTPLTPLSPSQFDEFRKFLRQSAQRQHVQVIAEEMSLEALAKRNLIGGSLPSQIAKELGLVHRYCDPDNPTRQEKGISGNLAREAYWRDQILSLGLFPVLFVCGANHVESFSAILCESMVSVEIIDRDWEAKAIEERPNKQLQNDAQD
jgi:hypothetical protein